MIRLKGIFKINYLKLNKLSVTVTVINSRRCSGNVNKFENSFILIEWINQECVKVLSICNDVSCEGRFVYIILVFTLESRNR